MQDSLADRLERAVSHNPYFTPDDKAQLRARADELRNKKKETAR